LTDKIFTNGKASMKASELCSWFADNLAWNDSLYPAMDFSSSPQYTSLGFGRNRTVLLSNQSRATILRDDPREEQITNLYIANCCDSTIYIGTPVVNVTIMGCVDCEIVIMAAMGMVTVSLSERVVLRAAAAHIRLENCIETSAYVYTTRAVLLTGDTRGVVLAPFNVVWPDHETLLKTRSSLHTDSSHATLWSQPICSCLSDSPYTLLNPEKFRLVHFPNFSAKPTVSLAVCLPQVYTDALRERLNQMHNLKREILSISDEGNMNKINAIISGHFREWVSTTNKAKVISDIIKQKT